MDAPSTSLVVSAPAPPESVDMGNLDAVADALSLGLAAQLMARLYGGKCEHCGASAISVAELELVRKFLTDNEVRRLQEAAKRASGRSASAIVKDLPFKDRLAEESPA